MSSIEESAAEQLKLYFEQLPAETFVEEAGRLAPGLLQGGNSLEFNPPSRPLLPRVRVADVELKAYLASALTNVSEADREESNRVSDEIRAVCTSLGIELYEPRRATDPIDHPDLSAPEVFHIDKEAVLSRDLLIHICRLPSTGSGEELAFAETALIPIILVYVSGQTVSRMIRGIPTVKLQVSYSLTDLPAFADELRVNLAELRPFLEERKLAFAAYDNNMIGTRVRDLRMRLHLTREEVASSVGMTEAALEKLECSTDRVSNPSISQLRQLATVLHTTVAELVVPDFWDIIYRMFQDWLRDENVIAARSKLSTADNRRIQRRVLLRLLEFLGDGEA